MNNVQIRGIPTIITFFVRLNNNFPRRSFILISAVTALGFLAGGCAEPDGSVGSGVGGGPEGVPGQITCQVQSDTSFHARSVGTGGSAHLYVGSSKGISPEAVMRFNRPLTSAAIRVDSARIDVAYQGGIGDGAIPEVAASLVYFPWSESHPPSRADLTGGTLLTANLVTGGDSGRFHYALDAAEVNAWFKVVDSSRADTGFSDPGRPDTSLTIVLRAPDAQDKLLRFRSRSATADSLRPYLMIFAAFPDSVTSDTIKVGAIGDLFLPDDQNPIPAGRLCIGGGAALRSALNFKLDSLWSWQSDRYIVVNRAVLTLTRDRALFAWAPWTKSVWPYQMTSKRWMTEPDSAEFSGFVFVPTAVDSAADTLQIVISTPTVTWARRDSTNYGLMIESAGEGLDIERIGFYDSTDPDPVKRPRLTIYYTELQR